MVSNEDVLFVTKQIHIHRDRLTTFFVTFPFGAPLNLLKYTFTMRKREVASGLPPSLKFAEVAGQGSTSLSESQCWSTKGAQRRRS